jgi:phospholipid/cholesterol/gamma-HCH transport system substrate-binding protein
MRRLAVILGLIACVGTLAVLGTGAGSSGGYQVRAIFDNAFSVIPGEDVKIAGVKVGTIDSLDVTPDQKAAVVLSITKPGFDDFRTDATCTIRPQSLIGEKFVECTPTQPRVQGAPPAPALSRVPKGQPGAGQYLLPDTQTTLPVDIDLLGNVLRLPYRERLSIILNEFGTGLAGRGQDLRAVIRRADPALQATDQVLNLLAAQNKVLDQLAVNSDTSLAPLARDRAKVADFIVQANTTAQATAERSTALEANIQRLPPFLQQLQPTMVRLGAFADEATPVLTDLGRQAPAISRFIEALGPFSKAATPSLKSLGAAADVGRVALPASLPIITELRSLASTAKPLAANLAALTTSLHDSGGLERFLDYLFYQEAAINGYDQLGHYLRAALIVNLCSTYATVNSGACSSNFKTGASARAAAASASSSSASQAGRSPYLVAEDRILHGASPASVLAETRRALAAQRSSASAPQASAGAAQGTSSGASTGGSAAPAGSGSAQGSGQSSSSTTNSLLSYLLGNG